MLTPIGASRQAFERAGEPQKFVTLPWGHFVPYSENFAQSDPAARDEFCISSGPRLHLILVWLSRLKLVFQTLEGVGSDLKASVTGEERIFRG